MKVLLTSIALATATLSVIATAESYAATKHVRAVQPAKKSGSGPSTQVPNQDNPPPTPYTGY
jgi:hypothetical protein